MNLTQLLLGLMTVSLLSGCATPKRGDPEFAPAMPNQIGILDQDYAVEFVERELPGAAIKKYNSHQELFDGVAKGEVRPFPVVHGLQIDGVRNLQDVQPGAVMTESGGPTLYLIRARVVEEDIQLEAVTKPSFPSCHREEEIASFRGPG